MLEWTVRGLIWGGRVLHPGRVNAKEDAGEAGERAAYFYLRRLGYTVVARRWRAPNLDGEIDLIAWDGEVLCFAEVKTRSAEDRFEAAYAVNEGKRKALRRMARAYVQGLPTFGDEEASPEVRFELLSVYLLGGEVQVEQDREFMRR